MNTTPLLSIVCTTYNHEYYIKNCLDGFVNQITNFDFEIIVHDDASTDNTAEIIRIYEIKYPNLFRNIFQKENQFNKKNINIWLDIVFPVAKGKYIALCEGDDYWTDCYKLQKQVDFLEKNDDFNICYHEVLILKGNIFSNNFIDKTKKNVTTIYDLATWGNYIHTCSVVFRKISFDMKYEDKKSICDYILYIIITKDKKIKKIEEKMAVYRYGNGIWSSTSNKKKQKFIIDNIYNILNTTKDDTIKEIMKLRLNTHSFFSLPNYLSKKENFEDRSLSFEINEKIPIFTIINIIKKKLFFKIKKYKVF